MRLGWARLLARLRGEPLPVPVETRTIRGFRTMVQNTRPDIATPDVLARLDEALALIETTQPRRFRRMQRDLGEFLVVRFPCRGAYFPDRRACLTELTFLARRDITAATVASSIVHEATHARLDAMGLHPASRDHAREERICRRAELDFGRALPAALGAPVVERAEQSLLLPDEHVAPEIDWAEARRQTEEIDRAETGTGTETGTERGRT